MLRIASFLALAASVALFGACSREAAPPAEAPPAETPSPTPEATVSAPAAEAPPAPSVAEPASSEPAAPPHGAGKRAPCTLGQDQTCNGDPAVSAIWGKCLPTGTCECKPGFVLAPTGYCQPAK